MNKPIAATRKEWRQWEKDARENHPIWYLFHETLPCEARYWWGRVKSIQDWIAHRTYDKHHVVRVYGMKPGYADKDHIMLHVSFGLLVDFVECEVAWMNRISGQRHRRRFEWSDLLFWKHYHSPQDGLEYLGWEAALVCNEGMGVYPGDERYGEMTDQARCALEQKKLYLWYRDRWNRPDPHDASGWNGVCAREMAGEEVPEPEVRAALDRCHALESVYEQEDEEMLVRLMRIRRSLWT